MAGSPPFSEIDRHAERNENVANRNLGESLLCCLTLWRPIYKRVLAAYFCQISTYCV